MLEAQQLCKTFTQGEHVVQAISEFSWKFDAGLTAIVGQSGSGKTTLLNMLAGFDTPTSGCVVLDGQPISTMPEEARSRVRLLHMGFVFQQWNLITTLSALENVMFPLMLQGVPLAERKQRAADMLEQVGLAHRIHHLPNQLSGGEQQRVAVARSFVTNPKVVFADEPTGNLDTATGGQVAQLLTRKAQEGMTLIMVTHSLHMAELASRVVTMRDGRIVKA